MGCGACVGMERWLRPEGVCCLGSEDGGGEAASADGVEQFLLQGGLEGFEMDRDGVVALFFR